MGQQHSQQSLVPNCPKIFRCWQAEGPQGTPFKDKAEEEFLYDIDMKDLLISNKERSKWTEENTTVRPFQQSFIHQAKKSEKKTADMTAVLEKRQSKAESQLQLPEFSCIKQLFVNNSEKSRQKSADTHQETIHHGPMDFGKQNQNTTNMNSHSNNTKKIDRESNVFIELSNTHSPKRHSKSLSITSDFLTPLEDSVHAHTPCSEKWQKCLEGMNRNKFQRSINYNSIQQFSSQGRKSGQVIHFMNANYIGSVQNDIPNGLGEFRYNNGDIQYGFFENNLCQGKGKYVKSDGTVYDGDFVNGQACGFGVYIGFDGYRYEGSWKANLPDGHGKVSYRDGSVYEGDLVQGKRNGKGRFVQNGCTYEGEFKNDKIEGMATLVSQGGETYKGEWKQDQFDGHGQYAWPNGDRYIGNYKRGRRSGYGVMIYSNGDTYAGNWRNGMKDGQGTFTSNNLIQTGWWVRSQYVESLVSQ